MQDAITTMFCFATIFGKPTAAAMTDNAELQAPRSCWCRWSLAHSLEAIRLRHGISCSFTATSNPSRFCRRLHAISQEVWRHLFWVLGEVFVRGNPSSIYVVDFLPIPACDNIRIKSG